MLYRKALVIGVLIELPLAGFTLLEAKLFGGHSLTLLLLVMLQFPSAYVISQAYSLFPQPSYIVELALFAAMVLGQVFLISIIAFLVVRLRERKRGTDGGTKMGVHNHEAQ